MFNSHLTIHPAASCGNVLLPTRQAGPMDCGLWIDDCGLRRSHLPLLALCIPISRLLRVVSYSFRNPHSAIYNEKAGRPFLVILTLLILLVFSPFTPCPQQIHPTPALRPNSTFLRLK